MIQSLLRSDHIQLTALDLDQEAETIAAWTVDPEYWNLYEREIPRPLSAGQVKKKLNVDPRDEYMLFLFGIRAHNDARLIGLAGLEWVDWSNSNAWLSLRIGNASDRGRGIEAESLALLLAYAFRELNLYRVQALVFEYALTWRQTLESAGFNLEVCRREEILRHGRRWNLLMYALFSSEWQPPAPIQGTHR
jgi:RimJ/RimL family protein N-acetyltransferase